MKYIKFFLFTFFLFSILIWFFYYVVNPEYRYENTIIYNNKQKYNKEFSRFLVNELNNKKYTLVFGTSRSHMIDENMVGFPTLNFHCIYGNAYSVFNVLSQLNKEQIKNINEIYYLIDIHILDGIGKRLDYGFRPINYNFYSMNEFKEKIFINFDDLNDAFKSLKNEKKYFITPYGYMNNYKKDTSVERKDIEDFLLKNLPIDPQDYTDDAIEVVGKINEFCEKNNIKITYITPTFPKPILKTLNLDLEFIKWSKLLYKVKKVHILYNIDNISDRIIDDKYIAFKDSGHLNYTYLDIIFNKYIRNNYYLVQNEEELLKIFEEIKK